MPSEAIVTLLAFSPLKASTVHVDTSCHLNFWMTATAAHGHVAAWIMLSHCKVWGRPATIGTGGEGRRRSRRVALGRQAESQRDWQDASIAAAVSAGPEGWPREVKQAPVRGSGKHAIVRSSPEEFPENHEALRTPREQAEICAALT